MLNALNIETREIIATGSDRKALAREAAELVGREGFCIREANPAPITTPENWCTTDGEWWI